MISDTGIYFTKYWEVCVYIATHYFIYALGFKMCRTLLY